MVKKRSYSHQNSASERQVLSASGTAGCHVWLPCSGVWAMIPPASSPTQTFPSARESSLTPPDPDHSRSNSSDSFTKTTAFMPTSPLSPSHIPRKCPSLPAPLFRTLSNQHSPVDSESPNLASCPICLASIALNEKAVLLTCLHCFCVPCIQQWSDVSRSCPLCKQEYVGWYFNITHDDRYDEKVLPVLKPRGEVGSVGGGENDRLRFAYEARGSWRDVWRHRRPPARPRTGES